MCHPARCRTCGLVTWRGCGFHVAQVQAMVPADQWCSGHEESGSGHGLVRRLLGR